MGSQSRVPRRQNCIEDDGLHLWPVDSNAGTPPPRPVVGWGVPSSLVALNCTTHFRFNRAGVEASVTAFGLSVSLFLLIDFDLRFFLFLFSVVGWPIRFRRSRSPRRQ